MLGATAGRTTLTGEGLQHADGHSQLLAATNPAVVTWDPAFGFEIGHIMRHGLETMYGGDAPHDDPSRNRIYYLTMYNEPIVQPAQPEGIDVDALLKGMYRYRAGDDSGLGGTPPRCQLLASGVGMAWALEAQQLLRDDWGVVADVWSVTSWSELRREAMACDEERFLHPDQERRTPFVTQALEGAVGPVVAVSDYMKQVQDQIRPWVPEEFSALGTDGFGFSDTRPAARRVFNVDAESIVVATLVGLARDGNIPFTTAAETAEKYQITDVHAAKVSYADTGSA